MRGLIVALAVAALGLLATASIALADGGPHSGAFAGVPDTCSDCHRTHTAVGQKLLKAADANTLCFSCHDGTGAGNDVLDGARLSTRAASRPSAGDPIAAGGVIQGALRGGGFAYARIDDDGDCTYPTTTSGTTVRYSASCTFAASPDGRPAVAMGNTGAGFNVTSAHLKGSFGGVSNGLTAKNIIWGNGAINSGTGKDLTGGGNHTLQCTDCHNQHGGAGTGGAATYRILRPIPNQSGGAAVEIGDQATKVYTTANYWLDVDVYTGTNTLAAWCATCHSRYLANGSAGHTDSGDTIFKYRHASNAASTITPASGPYQSVTAFKAECNQCHVAHGSDAVVANDHNTPNGFYAESYDIPWPGGVEGDRENGIATGRAAPWDLSAESALLKVRNRGTCTACHGTVPATFLP